MRMYLFIDDHGRQEHHYFGDVLCVKYDYSREDRKFYLLIDTVHEGFKFDFSVVVDFGVLYDQATPSSGIGRS